MPPDYPGCGPIIPALVATVIISPLLWVYQRLFRREPGTLTFLAIVVLGWVLAAYVLVWLVGLVF